MSAWPRRGCEVFIRRSCRALGGQAQTIGLYEGEPWIIPEWDSLQTYEFDDSLDRDEYDLESGDEDDDFDGSKYGWDT